MYMRSFWQQHARGIVTAVILAAVLAAAFFSGDSRPGRAPETETPRATSSLCISTVKTEAGRGTTSPPTVAAPADRSATRTRLSTTAGTHGATSATAAAILVPPGKPTGRATISTVQGENARPIQTSRRITGGQKTCQMSISCQTVLQNMDKLNKNKQGIVPKDGWMLRATTVPFTEGDSAFDALTYICRQQNIALEFSYTPLYHSAYIEGIGNLYEFDCGGRSGWTYTVNGKVLRQGASAYILQDGDVVEWHYTCANGADVGIQDGLQ